MSSAKKRPFCPRVTLHITQEVIDRAVRANSGHCVIADAIRAQIPAATGISVDLASIRWTEGDWRFIFLTPRVGQQHLVDFDQGFTVSPFTMQLGRRDLAQIIPKSKKGIPRGAKSTIESKPRERGLDGGKDGSTVRVGGQAPPLGAVAGAAKYSNGSRTKAPGQRRTFGARGLRGAPAE